MSEETSHDDSFKELYRKFDQSAEGLSKALIENIEVLKQQREASERRIKVIEKLQKRVDHLREEFKKTIPTPRDDHGASIESGTGEKQTYGQVNDL